MRVSGQLPRACRTGQSVRSHAHYRHSSDPARIRRYVPFREEGGRRQCGRPWWPASGCPRAVSLLQPDPALPPGAAHPRPGLASRSARMRGSPASFLWTRSQGRRSKTGRQLAAVEIQKVRRKIARHAAFTAAVEHLRRRRHHHHALRTGQRPVGGHLQPGRSRLTCPYPKMMLATCETDAHACMRRRPAQRRVPVNWKSGRPSRALPTDYPRHPIPTPSDSPARLHPPLSDFPDGRCLRS